jgi:myo-inositol-1(or 4)-monophosphatase
MEYKVFLEEVLIRSSEIALTFFGKVSGVVKKEDNNQVLTDADIAIGKYIVDSIRQEFSKHNIIDEEAGVVNNSSEYTWVVDPIDGTSNFANGLPMYGIMIGLLQGDNPIVGGIALPSFSEIYYAEKDKGTSLGDIKTSVSSETNLLSTLVAYGIDGHQEDPSLTRDEVKLFGEIVLNIRNLRSSNSAFDSVMVAQGKYGASLNKTSKIWDNVAQQIIIEEAGGVYTDFFGNPMDYQNPLSRVNENYTWCFGAPKLHKELQEIIHK